MPAIKVQIGDDTHEITPDALQLDGFQLLTQEQIDHTIKARLRREQEAFKAEKDGLVRDPEFFRKAAQAHNVELGDDLKPVAKLSPEQVGRLQEQWKTEHLAPVLKDLDAFKQEVEAGRRDKLVSEILRVAPEVGVKKDRLRSLFEGETPEFVDAIARRFRWDDDRKAWYFTDASGNPVFSENGYAGPKRLLETLRKADAEFVYFDDMRQKGSGFENSGGGGGQKVVTREQWEKMDPASQRAHLKAGGTLKD